MHVAFAETGHGLPDEGRLLLKIGNRLAAAISHARSDAADQLIDDRSQRTLVGHAPFDTFRDEFLSRASALAVAIAAAPLQKAVASSPSPGSTSCSIRA